MKQFVLFSCLLITVMSYSQDKDLIGIKVIQMSTGNTLDKYDSIDRQRAFELRLENTKGFPWKGINNLKGCGERVSYISDFLQYKGSGKCAFGNWQDDGEYTYAIKVEMNLNNDALKEIKEFVKLAPIYDDSLSYEKMNDYGKAAGMIGAEIFKLVPHYCFDYNYVAVWLRSKQREKYFCAIVEKNNEGSISVIQNFFINNDQNVILKASKEKQLVFQPF